MVGFTTGGSRSDLLSNLKTECMVYRCHHFLVSLCYILSLNIFSQAASLYVHCFHGWPSHTSMLLNGSCKAGNCRPWLQTCWMAQSSSPLCPSLQFCQIYVISRDNEVISHIFKCDEHAYLRSQCMIPCCHFLMSPLCHFVWIVAMDDLISRINSIQSSRQWVNEYTTSKRDQISPQFCWFDPPLENQCNHDGYQFL